MLWTLLFGVVAFVVVLWVTFRIFNGHVLRLCSTVPSCRPCYPVLGNALLFACSLDEMTKRLHEVIKKAMLEGQRAVCFWIGAYPLVFVTDPRDVRTILNTTLRRGKEMEESSKEYSKYGLVTSPVDYWKITRPHLNLSFHPRNLKDLVPMFNLTSRRLVVDLSVHVDGAAFDLMPHVMSAALRTICNFLYGPETMERVSDDLFKDLRHAVEMAAELTALRLTRPWLNIDMLFKLFYGKEINRVKSTFRKMLEIADISSEKCKGESKLAGNNDTQYAFQTILQAMRELQEKCSSVSDEHVMDEITSFFVAGTDTIGASVSSCLLALARFPRIQDKVYEEISSVTSEDDSEDIAHLDLRRFTYLDQVIKETLRFFTVIPFTCRSPDRDVDLGEYKLPANKLTGLWISVAFADPNYFPDPDKFDPDRFATPNSSDDFFIPFSRGPRNCIGKTYSMMLIKVMVVHVVRKYRLTTIVDIKNLKEKFTITLTSSDGYHVSLNKRRG